MMYKSRIRLIEIISRILYALCILFMAIIFIAVLAAINYSLTDAPSIMCLQCVGCPCPPIDFLEAKEFYLNVLFPNILLANFFFIIISTVLIVILKHKEKVYKFALFKKIGNSEDLFKIYKSLNESSESDVKSKRNRFRNNYS